MQPRSLLISIAVGSMLMSCANQEPAVMLKQSEYDALREKVMSVTAVPKSLIPDVQMYPKIQDMAVVIYNEHEYIVGSDEGGYNGGLFFTHSGECKKCQSMLREIIREEIEQAISDKRISVNTKNHED